MRPTPSLIPIIAALSLLLSAGCAVGLRSDDEAVSGRPAQAVTPVAWTGDPGGLTLDDVRQRAVAALAREGMVYHVTGSTEVIVHVTGSGDRLPEGQSQTVTGEAWLDLERDLGRSQDDFEGAVIYYQGRVARRNRDSGLIDDAPITWQGLDRTSAAAVDHIQRLFDYDMKDWHLSSEDVDGIPLLVVDITTKYEVTQRIRLFLDGNYLPVRAESRSYLGDEMEPAAEGSAHYENEFLTRDILPGDFFSPGAAGAR